ncbi:CoA-transferase family III domain-containing protein [Hyaloraphidium curvatum]|nr:CoA-transferase family III domain-containing protein [Hyaloraphidium curvatum]
MDVHAGARDAALRLLSQCGLPAGPGSPAAGAVAAVRLSGSRQPFVPSPFKIGELVAGAQIAMAAICTLLEAKKGGQTEATLDVEHAAFVLFAPFLAEWMVEGGGAWAEMNLLINQKMAEQLAAANNSEEAKGASEPLVGPPPAPSEELVDPPAGTPAWSPMFALLRGFLSNVWKTEDRHIFVGVLHASLADFTLTLPVPQFFPRVTDDPATFLSALGFSPAQIKRIIRLAIASPLTHPTTWSAHWTELLSILGSHFSSKKAMDLELAVKRIPAIAVVPRTRAEFDATDQGRALARVPRVGVERAAKVRGPRTLEEWDAAREGRAKEEKGGLWGEMGWKAGAKPGVGPCGRGVLYGIKVVEITRILAGPCTGLQLAQLGADVIRVASKDIVDYPAYDLGGINLNKRTAELDLKSAAGKAKLRELVADADVVVTNLLAGSMAKLGFGYEDVLSMVAGRGRGIVYAETNTFGFFGELAALPGVENLGQHISGVSMVQGTFQPYDPQPPSSIPTITPALTCDVTTGLNTAAGILAALLRRTEEGGSYLVRSSLTQTALALQDLGTYADGEAVRRMWDGYPKHEPELGADPAAVRHNGQLDYLLKFPLWMRERGVEKARWESGVWMRTADNPHGGTVQSLLPPIRFSCDGPNYQHIRFSSHPLCYDRYIGFAFDYDDPAGSDEDVREMLESGEGNTWMCRKGEEVDKLVESFVEGKRRTGSRL